MSMMNITNYSLIFTLAANISFTAFASDENEHARDFIPDKIVASQTHTCVLSKKGQVKCWGYNADGELGIAATTRHGRDAGSMGPNLPMVNFGTNLYAKDICTGARTTCVATTNDRVKCWGRNNVGQLGQERGVNNVGLQVNDMGDNLPFTDLGSDFRIKALHCGDYTNCAVSDTGKLKCWGNGGDGELGRNISPRASIGRLKNEMGDNLPFVALPIAVEHVAIGSSHTCAASKSDIYCWGYNNNGQAGIGSSETHIYLSADPKAAVKVQLEDDGVSTVIEGITSGYRHNCALYHLANRTAEQKIKCWGTNFDGALGIESAASNMGRNLNTVGSKLPETRLALSQIIQLEAHVNFSCALSKTGQAKCWGLNFTGQLGAGDSESRGYAFNHMGLQLPHIALGLPVIGISSGTNASSSCAILINHEIKCWGYGFYGGLGYENTDVRGTQSDDMGENLPYVRYK